MFRRCRSRYGLRGTRVGETSNPGLPKFLRRLRRGISSMSDPACTVPAPIGDIHVAHRVLEGGCVPKVVEMSVDDSKRKIQGRLSGNRFEALSDRAGGFSGACFPSQTEVGVVVPECRQRL